MIQLYTCFVGLLISVFLQLYALRLTVLCLLLSFFLFYGTCGMNLVVQSFFIFHCELLRV